MSSINRMNKNTLIEKALDVLNEVKISNTHFDQYFRLIQKAIGAKKYTLVPAGTDIHIIFTGGKQFEYVSLLLSKGYIIGYKTSENDPFVEIPKEIKSIKDIFNKALISRMLGADKSKLKQPQAGKGVSVNPTKGKYMLDMNETIKEGSTQLYRLYIDGRKGGWVESLDNIDGNAQVYEDAKVYGSAQVYGKGRVYGDAEVYGNTKVDYETKDIISEEKSNPSEQSSSSLPETTSQILKIRKKHYKN